MFSGIFIDPVSGMNLDLDESNSKASCNEAFFSYENGVIDFYRRFSHSCSPELMVSHCEIDPAQIEQSTAPELREAHDNAFTLSRDSGRNVYGKLEDLPYITQAGHFRRMDVLASLHVGDISKKVVVDFGTGPWGFAAIFPRLCDGGLCIGFDVSKVALLQARTRAHINQKTIYATSDGDKICLADDSVDIFFGGEVIEHVRKPTLFLQEIARICKEDALMILTTPNKDALLYKIAGIPFCHGPEHIALMNSHELSDALNLFCCDVSMIGYEISLYPDIDAKLKDQKLIERVNARAANFPELGSGLIASARVRKAKYRENRKDVILNETLWNSKILKDKIPGVSVHLFDEVYGISLANNGEFRIPVNTSDPTLLFWGHDWSGRVEIHCTAGGRRKSWTHDLFLPSGGFYRIDLQLPRGVAEVGVRRTGEKSDRSASSEVIFYKAFEYVSRTKIAHR